MLFLRLYNRATYKPSLTALVIRLAVFSSEIQYVNNVTKSLKALYATLRLALTTRLASL